MKKINNVFLLQRIAIELVKAQESLITLNWDYFEKTGQMLPKVGITGNRGGSFLPAIGQNRFIKNM